MASSIKRKRTPEEMKVLGTHGEDGESDLGRSRSLCFGVT